MPGVRCRLAVSVGAGVLEQDARVAERPPCRTAVLTSARTPASAVAPVHHRPVDRSRHHLHLPVGRHALQGRRATRTVARNFPGDLYTRAGAIVVLLSKVKQSTTMLHDTIERAPELFELGSDDATPARAHVDAPPAPSSGQLPRSTMPTGSPTSRFHRCLISRSPTSRTRPSVPRRGTLPTRRW